MNEPALPASPRPAAKEPAAKRERSDTAPFQKTAAIVWSAGKAQHAEFIELLKKHRPAVVPVAPRALRKAANDHVVVDRFCGDFLAVLTTLKQVPDARETRLWVLPPGLALTPKEQRLFGAVVERGETPMEAFVLSIP